MDFLLRISSNKMIYNRCFCSDVCFNPLRKCPGAALRVVLWSLFAHILTLYSSGFILLSAISSSGLGVDVSYLSFVLSIVQGLCFLLYPLAGILADMYLTRLKAMFYGTYIQLIGTVLVLAITVVFMINESLASHWYLLLVIVVAYAIIQLGLALSEANAIQFGTDQMPEASSSQLSAFIYWYFWSLFIGQGFLILINLYVMTAFRSIIYLSLLLASLIQIMTLVLAIVMMKRGIQYFEIEPAGKNPAKLIVNVIQYSIYHKTPEHRSAFTYGDEQTCRLDFAKYRYGGPFSTEEVENVKTFLRIILIFASLIGFQFTDATAITTKHIRALTDNVTSASPWYTFITTDTFGVSTFVILIGIPLYQLILQNVTRRCALSMFKRMFLGLLCGLIAVLFLQLLEVFIAISDPYIKCPYFTNNLLSSNKSLIIDIDSYYNYLIIPQALNGLTFLLVFLTVMEFILAQAPRDMQGFLIGIWYSQSCVNLFISAIESFTKINCWGYILSIKAVAMIPMLVFYVVVAVKYKRRTREEASDVNAQRIIEEYCERQIMEDEDERQNIITYKVFYNVKYDGTHIIM